MTEPTKPAVPSTPSSASPPSALRRPRNRAASLAIGVLLILVGCPMLACPGPGIGAILAGAGFVWFGLTGRELTRRPPDTAPPSGGR